VSEPSPTFDSEVAPGAAFERAMHRVGLFLGPTVALAIILLSPRGGFFMTRVGADAPPSVLPALMALCVIWWITEALPPAVVALAAACGAVLTGLATPKEAFGALGTPLLFLFVGSFFIAEAVKNHGLGARIAQAMTSIARTRGALLAALAVTAFSLSTVMSNAAATAIVLPLALPLALASGDRRFGAAVVLAVAWGASVGGVVTPVGTPPNLIGLASMRAAGHDVSFLGWMRFGLPIGLVMLAAMLLVLTTVLGVRGGEVPRTSRAREPWSAGERSAVIALALALTGWLVPTILELAAPGAGVTRWVSARLTEEVVAVLAGCSLFLLPGGGDRRALTWPEAVKIDWGVIFLFGGGILLGDLARQNGLSEEWGRAVVEATGAHSTWAIVALCTAAAIVLSELTSNTATATLMAPLAANLALAAGAAPLPAILGATLGSSFGFMLPISTAPNAMAYGTGQVRVVQMARAGVVFDLVGFVVIVGGLYVLSLVGAV
jgi:sodium-dependent dicarboxylate transporter 2/3/5